KRIYFLPLLTLMLPLMASPLPQPKRVTAAEFGEPRQPQISISDEGTIYVVMGKVDSIYVTRSDDNGESFSEAVKVAELPKLALGMRRGPRIATSGSAVIVTAI